MTQAALPLDAQLETVMGVQSEQHPFSKSPAQVEMPLTFIVPVVFREQTSTIDEIAVMMEQSLSAGLDPLSKMEASFTVCVMARCVGSSNHADLACGIFTQARMYHDAASYGNASFDWHWLGVFRWSRIAN